MSRSTSIIYLILFLVLNYLLVSHYRPYIYLNKIDDFGLADVGNNFIFIPGIYFMLQAMKIKKIYGKIEDIYIHLSVLIFFEFLSKYVNHIGVFDYKDVLALILGAFLTHLIVKIYNIHPNN